MISNVFFSIFLLFLINDKSHYNKTINTGNQWAQFVWIATTKLKSIQHSTIIKREIGQQIQQNQQMKHSPPTLTHWTHKKTRIYDVRNPGIGLEQASTCGGLKLVNRIPTHLSYLLITSRSVQITEIITKYIYTKFKICLIDYCLYFSSG